MKSFPCVLEPAVLKHGHLWKNEMASTADYQGIVQVQGGMISEALIYVCMPLYFQPGLDLVPSLAQLRVILGALDCCL